MCGHTKYLRKANFLEPSSFILVFTLKRVQEHDKSKEGRPRCSNETKSHSGQEMSTMTS